MPEPLTPEQRDALLAEMERFRRSSAPSITPEAVPTRTPSRQQTIALVPAETRGGFVPRQRDQALDLRLPDFMSRNTAALLAGSLDDPTRVQSIISTVLEKGVGVPTGFLAGFGREIALQAADPFLAQFAPNEETRRRARGRVKSRSQEILARGGTGPQGILDALFFGVLPGMAPSVEAGFQGIRAANASRIARAPLSKVIAAERLPIQAGEAVPRIVEAPVDFVRRVTRDSALLSRPPGGSVMSAPALDPAVVATDKLVTALRTAKPLRGTVEALRAEELSRRAGAIKQVFSQAQGEVAIPRALSELKGKLPISPQFESIAGRFTKPDRDLLMDMVTKSIDLSPFDKLNTGVALQKLMLGELPTRSETILLEAIFGQDLGAAILAMRPFGQKAGELALDLWGLPRAFVASYDVSAPLRQGIMLAPGHPKEFFGALAPMFRAWAKPEAAEAVQRAIVAHPLHDLLDLAKVHISPIGGKAIRLGTREEPYMTSFASKIPGIQRSERAYVTFLNKLRSDTFYTLVEGWERSGKEFVTQDLIELGNFINAATGRGKLGALERAAPILNNVFFAPRYAISRFQVLGSAAGFNKSALVRREAIRSLLLYYGTGVSILSMLKLSGLADVELDPRSSDFGKIRVGKTRIDFWGGQQQVARYVTQLTTGSRKPTGDGEVQDIEGRFGGRLSIVGRFGRSKLHPGTGLLVDIVLAEDFSGDELRFDNATLKEQAFNRLVPLAAQDIVETAQEDLARGAIIAPLAMLGLNVQTFPTLGDLQNEVSQSIHGLNYDELNRAQQEQVNADPLVDAALAKIQGRPIKVSDRNRIQLAHERWDQRRTELEAGLRTKIEAGLSGEGLRKAIQDFKQNRFQAGQALFGGLENERDQVLVDRIAEQYWNVPLPDDDYGRPDYIAQDVVRSEVLKQAAELGLSIEYITGSGEGSFRGTRYDDPVVLQALEEWEQDSLILRPYWNIQNEVLEEQGALDEYREWLSLPGAEQVAFLSQRRNRNLVRAFSIIQADKAKAQRDSEVLSRTLEKWGYEDFPFNTEVLRDIKERMGQVR